MTDITIFNHTKNSYKCPNTDYTYINLGFSFIIDDNQYLKTGDNTFISLLNFSKLNTSQFVYYVKKNIKLIKILNSILDKNKCEWSWKIDCSNINSFSKLNKLVSVINKLYQDDILINCININFVRLHKIYTYYLSFYFYKFNITYN
jgi:hypothetical protein